MTIKLYNTAVRKKVDFEPIDAGDVRMYVCGPTVYDRAHLGNARPVIVFDTLFRLLRHTYGADHVTYVRNFTDVDDKINATALARQEAGASGSLEELIAERSDETISWYREDMAAVGAMEPSKAPRATDYIAEMIAMIQTLEDKDFAYSAPSKIGHNSGQRYVWMNAEVVQAHSFFKVDEFDRYGDLSGRSVDEMIAGARAETGDGKKNPMDFVLWKPSTEDQPGWDSPWGRGRPGWHIECSAMSKALLGDTFDIHGGGLDLQFPHHENEIAQSCCANGTEEMAHYWMHNEMLQVEGKKMSKSLGNFFTVRDLLDGHDGQPPVPGEVIRFVMLSTHYRKPMDWTEKKRAEAEKTLRKIVVLLSEDTLETVDSESSVPAEILAALSDDLNTALALTHLRKYLKQKDKDKLVATLGILGINWWALVTDLNVAKAFAGSADGVMVRGSTYASDADTSIVELFDKLVDALSTERKQAVATKDFSAWDKKQNEVKAAGILLQVEGETVTLKQGPSFDPSKLEGLL